MTKNLKLVIIAIIIIGVAISGVLGYQYAVNNKPKQSENFPQNNATNTSQNNITLTVPLAPGSVLNLTFYKKIDNITSNPQSILVSVVSYNWPLVELNITGNTTNQTTQSSQQPIEIAYTLIELPKNFVGKNSFNAPIAVPVSGEGLCVTFSLRANTNNIYTYVSNVSLNNYNIIVIINVTDSGLVKNATYVFKQNPLPVPPLNKSITVTQYINISINKSNGPYTVSYNPTSWFCSPPISSDLVFVWDSIIKLTGNNATIVDINELHKAVQNGAIVAFLDKGCPHCQRSWPHILEAVRETNKTIYVVILGNMMNITYYNYIKTLMDTNGITGVPTMAYFKNGFIPNPQYRVTGENVLANTTAVIKFLNSIP